MTIQLDDKSYIVGMWFSSNPITQNDWLGCVVRDPKNPKKYLGWSRFRYTKDVKIWDSEDEKSWTNFSSQEGATDQQMINFMQLAQKQIAPGYPHTDCIIVQGNLKKLISLSKGKDWLNMKQEKRH